MIKPKHILLAYSGGLDTSAAVHFLKKHFNCRVTAYCADLGQREDWDQLEKRALAAGADEFVLEDMKTTFVEDYIFPALKANATYERAYLLGTPLARPVIVHGMIQYSRNSDVDCLAHGCTHKGNDQVRFEMAAKYLAPDLPMIAPWRIWKMKSREDLLGYCKTHNIPIVHCTDDLLSHDENLAHITTEGEYLEDPSNEFRWEDACWITPPFQAPDRVEKTLIRFEKGIPVSLDGREMSGVDLIRQLNETGSRNGVGLQDIIENRINGLKVRGIFESPGLFILHAAHLHLEKITLSESVERIRNSLIDVYGEIVYQGLWFSEERNLIQALIDRSQQHVTGDVLMSLYKGTCHAVSVCSKASLYRQNLVSLHEGDTISVDDAAGFLNTIAMRIVAEASRRQHP